MTLSNAVAHPFQENRAFQDSCAFQENRAFQENLAINENLLAPTLANLSLGLASFVEAPVVLREERSEDFDAREDLLDAALGPTRTLKTCERLREGQAPAEGLALVATCGERLVGSVRLWRVMAGDCPALLLGPLGVAADMRSCGIGARLIGEALFRAVCGGHGAVLLVGDAPYYGRFGFERRLTEKLAMPGPVELERFLALELRPGALAGATGLVTKALPQRSMVSRRYETRLAA